MSAAVKAFLLWATSSWLCGVSVLASFILRDEAAPMLFAPVITATFVGFIWLVGDATKVGPWPAIAAWAFLGWQVFATLGWQALS